MDSQNTIPPVAPFPVPQEVLPPKPVSSPSKLFPLIVGGLILAVVALASAYYLFLQKNVLPITPIEQACTMEAMLCPDGSAVGRSGPNCEFAPCPEVQATPATDATESGEKLACPRDTFTCEDGTQVIRTEPDCSFVCPSASDSAVPNWFQ